MINMEQLFKQVFNNRYIFNIIYSFVHCKDSVLNWRISEIIKNLEHDKFNRLFENHFNGGNNSSDIDNWQYRITPNEQDIIEILGYRELGFNRFLQFYNEFSNKFKTIRNIMKKVTKCGNLETYEFLMKQGYSHNPASEIKRTVYDEMLVESFYDCGNSIDILNYILQYSNKGNQLNQEQNIKVLRYYIFKKYDQLYSTLVQAISTEKDLLIIIGASLDHPDTNLANVIIQHPLFIGLPEFCINFLKLVKMKTCFIMSDQCFQVVKIYLDKKQNQLYNIGIFEKLEYHIDDNHIDKSVYGIKFWDINDCDHLLISLSKSTPYIGELILYPNSLRQFKYQMQVPNLKFNFFKNKNLHAFASYLSTHICQLDYIKYFLELYQDNITEGYVIDYYHCIQIFLYSTMEIAQFILNEKMTLEISNCKNNYSVHNTAFFGDLNTLKLVESSYPHFINMRVLDAALWHGYLDIVKHVLPLVPDFSPSLLYNCSRNNQFATFSYIINNMNESRITKIQNFYQNDTSLKPIFQNLMAEKYLLSIPKYHFKNINLFKQLFKNDFQTIINEFSTVLIECDIHVFHYLLIDNKEQVFSSILNEKSKINQFIKTLVCNDIKKLIYYISNTNNNDSKYNLLNEYHSDIIRISLSFNYNSISSIINLILNQQNFKQCYYDLTFYSILFKNLPPKHSNYICSNDFSRFKLPNNLIVTIDQNNFIDYITLSYESITINRFINQVQLFNQHEINILTSIGLNDIGSNIQKSTINNLNNTDSIIDLNKELKF